MRRLLFVVTFGVLAWCVAPGVELFDAGELTTAAVQLGVSHPPAQPLHAMLGALASFVPVGELAFRVNVLSALAAALAVVGLWTLLAERLPAGRSGRIASAVATLLVALSPLVLEQGLRAEVYAPCLALVVWGARFAVRALRSASAGDVLAAGFCFALAAGAQPLVALAAAAGPALGLGRMAWRGARLRRLAPWSLALGALALLVYAYVPLRASAPGFAWGGGLFAPAYADNFALAGLMERLPGHLLLLGEGSGLPLLLLGGAGLAFAIMTRLPGAGILALMLPGVLLATATQRVFHPENPDVHGYLTPALVPLALGLGALIAGGGRALARLTRLPETALAGFLAVPALGLGLLAPHAHASGAARRHDAPARLAQDLLLAAPPGPSLLMADSDHALFPALYEHLVAGTRPDVALGNGPLASSSWFVRWVKRQRPELFVPWVDDGVAGDMPDRLIGENLRRGHGVIMQLVPSRPSVALRAGYRLGEGTPQARAPLRYDGLDGQAVARFEALERASWEAAHGHWRAALAGLSAPAEVLAATASIPATARPLWPRLPALSRRFISAPWQEELVVRDVAFWAGFDAGPPAPGSVPELFLLESWHRRLAGDAVAADRLLAGLPVAALLATCDVFPAEATAILTAAVAREPANALLWKQLGLAHAKGGDRQAADQAWATAQRLAPEDPEIPAWRQALTQGK